jgi:NitT/TauT family transport system permease protein
MTMRPTTLLRAAFVPTVGLLLWEGIVAFSAERAESIAAPSEIARAFLQIAADGSLAKAVAETFGTTIVGLAIGGGLGVCVGILFGLYPIANRLFEIPYEVLRPIPAVALIPLALLTFGFGLRMGVAVVAFACFWPSSNYATAATREVEPRLLEVCRVLGLGLLKRVYSVVLPAALPRIFVGLRVAAAVALIVSVTVEVAANPRGLGYAMIIAQQSLQPDVTFAFLFAVGIVGWLFNYSLLAAQHLLFPNMTPSLRGGRDAQ